MKTNSAALTAYLQQEMNAQGGIISFAHFMQLALYHPQWGYYNSPQFDLGKAGDFITAPEISPLFAKCFALQFAMLFKQLGTNNVLEIGAGTGRFASVLLPELEKLNSPCSHYYIYEISPALRKKQQTLLQTTCPTLFSRLTWLEQLPKHFSGIVIANEVLDALPTHCFCVKGNEIKERCVTWQDNQFTWQVNEPLCDELCEKALQLKKTYCFPNDYESEINLQIPTFIQTITDAIEEGIIFFIDYGYGQQEYFHPQRQHGTLTCFYQHHSHHNPFIHIGSQDITTHVDFTNVIENIGENCLLRGFTSQAAFLLDCGLLELAAEEEQHLDAREQMQLHTAIKLLTLPTEMGERIKVMAIQKHPSILDLNGFRLVDRRRDL